MFKGLYKKLEHHKITEFHQVLEQNERIDLACLCILNLYLIIF